MHAANTEADMRLFIAVPLPQVVSEHIQRWSQEIGKQMLFRKWVHPQDYHITVQFLGDVKSKNVDSILSSLQAAVVKQQTIELSLQGAGVFGLSSAPRVLWAGIAGETEKLGKLQQAVTTAMLPLGFKPEDRPYRPHITVARKYKGGSIAAELINTGPEPVSWTTDKLVLFRTHMHSSPMYEILGEVRFGS
ncbi:RNA 2',3'-cyclic phosphodiesterase [Paenibacillus dakarensis]|uniref:RNA 2',3'-cyclic phosphodiesterase n=1 Tax=Paenibacillus dakarensis TaxID=1527293 RepID=UPI0006D56C86|nr:RNA 2',3'-cyclic phosphodiesterase [Paenibacillus dakarensis]